jgi:hypothetical protein
MFSVFFSFLFLKTNDNHQNSGVFFKVIKTIPIGKFVPLTCKYITRISTQSYFL